MRRSLAQYTATTTVNGHLQEVGDGAAGDGAGGRDGHLLDVVGVEVQLGPDLVVDAAGHDFAPPLRQLLDPGSIHRW